MGFISSNEKYYLRELSLLEGKKLNSSDLYKAKQLLKVLDDLADEGYFKLNKHLEDKYQIITRLHAILTSHSEKPFPLLHSQIPKVQYGEKEFEIKALCKKLTDTANKKSVFSDNSFLKNIRAYCDWLEYDNDTAYVFLLRDALLPYIYFRSRDRVNTYPWLISRDFLKGISGKDTIDDEIRLPIYNALDSGVTKYFDFKNYFKDHIDKVLKQYPLLVQILRKLLSEITQEKIMVIESGYCGTIPMLLSALDERVDFRLYTTAPLLYDVYEDKIFCRRYEDLRLFETLYSQDLLMKYTSFSEGKFYVKLAQNDIVRNEAMKEIYSVM